MRPRAPPCFEKVAAYETEFVPSQALRKELPPPSLSRFLLFIPLVPQGAAPEIQQCRIQPLVGAARGPACASQRRRLCGARCAAQCGQHPNLPAVPSQHHDRQPFRRAGSRGSDGEQRRGWWAAVPRHVLIAKRHLQHVVGRGRGLCARFRHVQVVAAAQRQCLDRFESGFVFGERQHQRGGKRVHGAPPQRRHHQRQYLYAHLNGAARAVRRERYGEGAVVHAEFTLASQHQQPAHGQAARGGQSLRHVDRGERCQLCPDQQQRHRPDGRDSDSRQRVAPAWRDDARLIPDGGQLRHVNADAFRSGHEQRDRQRTRHDERGPGVRNDPGARRHERCVRRLCRDSGHKYADRWWHVYVQQHDDLQQRREHVHRDGLCD